MWAAPGFWVLGPVLFVPSCCLHLILEKEDMIAIFVLLLILAEIPGFLAQSALPDPPLVATQTSRELRVWGYQEEGVYWV